MNYRRISWIITGIGSFLILSPFYWESILNSGAGEYIDWLADLGPTPQGTYHFAIGGMYLFAGIIGLHTIQENKWTNQKLFLGALITLVSIC